MIAYGPQTQSAVAPFLATKPPTLRLRRGDHSGIEARVLICRLLEYGGEERRPGVSGAAAQQGDEIISNKLLISLVGPAGLEPATRPL